MAVRGSLDMPLGAPASQDPAPLTRYDLTGVEVAAFGVTTVLDAFATMHALSGHLFRKVGLVVQRNADGEWCVDPEQHYPLTVYLRLLYEIGRLVGDIGLRAVGAALTRTLEPLPGMVDYGSALELLDDAFYLYHTKNGQPMLDIATGKRAGEIGHLKATRTSERSVRMTNSTPYPCAFGFGVMRDGLAQVFNLSSPSVRHEAGGCRMHGAPACHYAVSW